MVWDLKIAHFDPGSGGICPVGCPCQDFEKIAIYGIFGPFWQNGYVYFFYGSWVSFSLKMLLLRDIHGASKNPLGSLQLHGVLELWPPEVLILTQTLWDGRPKIAISRDFWHFFNFDVFLKGEPRGIQKTQAGPPNWLWYPRYCRQKFQFHWKKMRKN